MFDRKQFQRKADVRGVYPNQLNEELAFFTGRYLVRYLADLLDDSSPKVLIGRDGRTSSPAIYAALINGISVEGGQPLPAGLCTTDMVQWGVGMQLQGTVAGAMVTASHNPPEYNGVKMVVRNPETGSVDMVRPIDHLKTFADTDEAEATAPPAITLPYPSGGQFALQEDFVRAACERSRHLKHAKGTIVIDPGNGVGGILIPLLKEELKRVGADVEIITVFGEIDGTFPNRPSNPGLPGAVKQLQQTVKEVGAKFGAAFDGDADRVFLVNEKGQFVPGSQLLAALSSQALKTADATLERKPIVFANVASFCVINAIRTGGGLPVYCRVGQDSAKTAITSTAAVFGGESSAHYNFPDTYCLDSGLFSLMMFWDILLETGKVCSDALKPFAEWPCSGEINLRIHCSDWQKLSTMVINMLRQKYEAPLENCYISNLDGLAVYHPKIDSLPTADDLFIKDEIGNPAGNVYRFVAPGYRPEWWLSVRASNNEPLLRVNYECVNAAYLDENTKTLIDTIHNFCTNNHASVSIDSPGYLPIALG